MPEAHYYIALCLLSKHSYEKAYEHLTTLIDKFPKFNKKTVFIFAAIAAKNLEMVEKALELVSAGIGRYPDYIDLYLYRAKLHEQLKQYPAALLDYEHSLKTKKNHPETMLNYALCLQQLGQTSNCLSALNAAYYCDGSEPHRPRIHL